MSWIGPRNPYLGKLGVIEEGAYADILLVNDNPLENLSEIMKDGQIYKNTITNEMERRR